MIIIVELRKDGTAIIALLLNVTEEVCAETELSKPMKNAMIRIQNQWMAVVQVVLRNLIGCAQLYTMEFPQSVSQSINVEMGFLKLNAMNFAMTVANMVMMGALTAWFNQAGHVFRIYQASFLFVSNQNVGMEDLTPIPSSVMTKTIGQAMDVVDAKLSRDGFAKILSTKEVLVIFSAVTEHINPNTMKNVMMETIVLEMDVIDV